MYIKEMPKQGPNLRTEIISSFRDSKTLSEKIKEIVKGDDDADKTPDGFIRDRSNGRNKQEDDNEDGAKQD
jgi:hypothetical protein